MRRLILKATTLLALSQAGLAEEARRLLLPLPHASEVSVMAFNGSRHRLATGDKNGLIKIWNWDSKTVELTLQPARGDERQIEWLGWLDEDTLVTRRSDYDYRVYDASTGNELGKIEGSQRGTPGVLPGNLLVVVHSPDEGPPQLQFLSAKDGSVVRTLPVPGVDKPNTHWVKGLAVSPDGKRIALSLDPIQQGDESLVEIDAATGATLRSAEIKDGYAPEALVYSPSGRSIAGNSWDVVLWTESGIKVHKPDRAGLKGMQWASDQELLYLISNDGATLHRLNAGDGQAVQVRKVERGFASAPLVISPEGVPTLTTPEGHLISGQTDAEIVRAASLDGVQSVAFHPSGRLLTGLKGGDVLVWDMASGKYERRLVVPGAIRGLAFTSDGQRLAVATNHDNDVRIFDWKSGKLVSSIKTQHVQGAGYVLQFSPNNELLAVLESHPPSWTEDLNFYKVRTGEQARKQETRSHFAFHPRESRVAVLRPEGMAEINLNSGDETLYKLKNLVDCGYDAQGNLFALKRVGNTSSLLKMYPKTTGRLDEAITVREWYATAMDKLVYNARDRSWWLHANSNALFHVDEAGKDLGRIPEGVTYQSQSSWQVLPNNTVAVRGREGTVEFWRQGQTLPEGQLIALESGKNWLVTSGNGLFDGTSEAERLIEWQVGRQRYRLDQFFQQGYRPGLLRELYRGASVSKTAGPLSQLRFPPKLEIVSPAPGTRVEGALTEVTVRMVDQGSGFSKPKIFVNGHALAATPTRSSDANVFVFKTRLSPGINEIRATGYDGSGLVESRGDKMRVTCLAAERRKPTLYVVAVGVNKAAAGRPLQFAENDAKSFAARLNSGLYPDNQIRVLTGPRATKAGLDAAFRELETRAQPQDTLIVFFAGHGVAEGDGYRFLLTGKDSQLDSMSSHELAGYLESIGAQKQFVVLDTCHSAAASPDLAARFAVSQQRMARGSGTFLLAACRSDETAAEIPALKHGLLTYTLLSGFGKNRVLTVNGLIQFVSSEFPEISRRHAQSQELYQFTNGTDFPLAAPKPGPVGAR
jgi:WD40 repeat protein